MDADDIVLRCLICTQCFNSENVRPTVLGCGHSFCEECINKVSSRTGRCPTCQTDICSRTVNYQLLEQLEQINKIQEHQTELELKLKFYEDQKTDAPIAVTEKKMYCSTGNCKNSFKLEIARICQTCNLKKNANNDYYGYNSSDRKTFPITPKSINNNYHYQPTIRYWDIKEPQFELPRSSSAVTKLLCPECVLDGIHKTHNVVKYFDLKKEKELNKFALKLAKSFGESCSELWAKAQNADQTLTDNLKILVEANQSAVTWKSFEDENKRISDSLEFVKEEKQKMLTAMSAYITMIEDIKAKATSTISANAALNR